MNPLVFEIFVTFLDDSGETTVRSWYVDSGTALSDLVFLIPALVTLIEPLVTGGIIGAGFTVSVDISALGVGAAGALSDIEEIGRFAYRTVNNFVKRISIPTFDESLVIGGSDNIDLTDADVQAFNTAMTDGIDLTGAGGSGVVQFTDYRAEDLTVRTGEAVEDFL
jgi:hypothetical protein